jgi:hypothetical protein
MPDPAPDRFPCPWLGREIELPRERELHIEARHPDLLPRHRTELAEVLADPDIVRRNVRAASLLSLSRWYTDVRVGRHVVVVVLDDARGGARSWIVTAYAARRIRGGEVLWRRS